MQTVEVNISATGDVQVAAKGVNGPGCKALTAAIEAAIGSTTGDSKTPEFYGRQQTQEGQACSIQQ